MASGWRCQCTRSGDETWAPAADDGGGDAWVGEDEVQRHFVEVDVPVDLGPRGAHQLLEDAAGQRPHGDHTDVGLLGPAQRVVPGTLVDDVVLDLDHVE